MRRLQRHRRRARSLGQLERRQAAAATILIGGGILVVAAASIVAYKVLSPEMLSEHFSIRDLLRTSHTSVDNTPDAASLSRLRKFAQNFLEPVYRRFGPLYVTSGYRSPALNARISGSASDSAHLYGCAADFVVANGSATPTEVVRWIKQESGLPYDQVIDEASGTSRWVHLGMLRPAHETAPRRQALTMRNGSYTAFA